MHALYYGRAVEKLKSNCAIHWIHQRIIQRTHPPFKQLGPVGFSYLFRKIHRQILHYKGR